MTTVSNMANEHKPSFGWDLAGYGKSGSALCRADRDGDTIVARVFRAPFICCPKLGIGSLIHDTVEIELEMLRRFAALGNSYLDVPVDLQRLSRVVDHRVDEQARYYWQLIKRPVDHIFKALEPLASNLGFAVARTAHLIGRLATEEAGLVLNKNLFETYPAATLQLVWHTNKWTEAKYKGGKVVYRNQKWEGQAGKKKDEKARTREKGKNDGLATLANQLGFLANEGDEMSDDEFDAVLCALTGCIADCTMSRESLATTIRSRLIKKHGKEDWIAKAEPPEGYVVFDRMPRGLRVQLKLIDCSTHDALLKAIGSATDHACEPSPSHG